MYGSGDLVGLDYEGNVLWSRNLEAEYGNISIKYGYSSSPEEIYYLLFTIDYLALYPNPAAPYGLSLWPRARLSMHSYWRWTPEQAKISGSNLARPML